MFHGLTGGFFRIIAMVTALLGGTAFAQTPDAALSAPERRIELSAGAPSSAEISALEADILDRIVMLLSGYEYFPTAEDLTAVTADPVPYLLAIAYDTEGRWLPTHHHRAVGALAYFPTAQCRSHLLYLLDSELTPELMRHHVINALANGFGDSALPELEPFLQSDDLQLRLSAVAAIGSIESSRSVEALQRALTVEDNALVRERIERSLVSEPRRPLH